LAVAALIGSLVIAVGPASADSATTSPTCLQQSTIYCTGSLVGPLAVSGRRIVDEGQGGVPVLLQGVTFDGPAWLRGQPSFGGFPDAGAIATLRAWGVNFVRLGLSSDLYTQRCGEDYAASFPDPGYAQDVTDAVNELTGHGMYVLIELYSSNPGCLFPGPVASNMGAPMPGQDAMPFWQAMATEFGANPLVGFEPWNEPQVCAQGTGAVPFSARCSQTDAETGWADNLEMATGTTSYPDSGMDQLFGVIHAAAPTSLVFLDANGFATTPTTFDSLPSDMATSAQIVYAIHPYDCQDTSTAASGGRSSARCQEQAPEACATIERHLARVLDDPATRGPMARPVDITEIGFPEFEAEYVAPRHAHGKVVASEIRLYDRGTFINNFIATAQALGDGFALFAFGNADTGSDWNGPYGLVRKPIRPGDAGPWPPSADGAPLQAVGTGTTLSCQNPPFGYDTWAS
jgi:hypothetical protein